MQIFLPVIIVTVIGLIAGLGLALASKFMAVPTDEKQEKVRECLPGANCGACGYSGCDGYAAAVASGEAPPDKCAPGGSSTAVALAELLGVEVNTEPKVAFIACNGSAENTEAKYAYSGMMSCAAANLVQSGPMQCKYGCIGFGDCYKSCPFGAITMQNGRPVICKDICVGCGKCASVCPKSLISIIPKSAKVHVSCANKAKGVQVAKSCKVSCISCQMCAKNCPSGAIEIKDNVAVINYDLCTSCGKCKEVCKRNVIV
ncbi:MAG: Fe-S cluster domain-containing protein [Clostridia bacterium]|nr:Fe-S cluster domain-containing protein [Clostridia bacterium]